MYKRASQQAGQDSFLNSEMPKKIHARPSINKSTERHPREPYYMQFAALSQTLQLASLPDPASEAKGIRRKLHRKFFCSEGCEQSYSVPKMEKKL